MKTQALTLIAVLLLSACASQPDYKAANRAGYGYKETQLSESRYRVQYKARGEGQDTARDYALLRAAELTLLEGYDWFVVVDRETLVNREQHQSAVDSGVRYDRVVTRDCGLLNCTTSYKTVPTYSMGLSSGTPSRGDTEAVLEIMMGKGVRPASGDSYDAVEVRDNLQQRKLHGKAR